MTNPLFYAKILLFGEYGIIEDSQGLTLPYSFYKGTLKFSENQSDFEKKSNESLSKYAQYLSELNLQEAFKINVEAFKKDIEKGLFFDSNIPQGYGVGSPGRTLDSNIRLLNSVKHQSHPGGYEGRRTGMIYRVAFTGRGAEYTRCFTSKEERDRFAESMRQAGYKVHAWE
jgi:hypothetical protein